MLVEYSDSEDSNPADTPNFDDKPSKPQGTKRKRPTSETKIALPPLPDSFHDLYVATARNSNQDDPTLHAGRQRHIPHVEGNWPTHVYIEWYPSTEQYACLHNLICRSDHANSSGDEKLHSFLESDLGAETPLHISLSRPIVLLADQRLPFLEALTLCVERSGIQPFTLSTSTLDWVANHENTRWFLVLRLDKAPQDGLNRLLRLSNNAAAVFGQPPLYQKEPFLQASIPYRKKEKVRGNRGVAPSPWRMSYTDAKDDLSSHFHVSIAWTLRAPSKEIKEMVKQLNREEEPITFNVSMVKVKIGNSVSPVSLSSRKDTSNGIIEH